MASISREIPATRQASKALGLRWIAQSVSETGIAHPPGQDLAGGRANMIKCGAGPLPGPRGSNVVPAMS